MSREPAAPSLVSTTRRVVLALLTALLTVTVLVGVAPVVTAATPASGLVRADGPADQLTFGVATSGPKGPDDRPFFGYLLAPGQVVRDHVALVNLGLDPVTLTVYPQDALNTESGAFDVLTSDRQSTDVGTWISLKRTKVRVKAGGRVVLPFTIRVPDGATPGDHVGGIVASLPTLAEDASGNKITIDRRVGSRVYLRVSGDLAPGLTVSDVKASYEASLNPFGAGATKVTYTLSNTGNVRLGAQQLLTVKPRLGGPSVTAKPGGVVEILPGNSITITQNVPGVLPMGAMTATVTIQPLPRPGDAFGVIPPVNGSDGFWALSWVLVVVLLLVVLLGVGWFLRRRAGVPGAPAEPDQPTELDAMASAR